MTISVLLATFGALTTAINLAIFVARIRSRRGRWVINGVTMPSVNHGWTAMTHGYCLRNGLIAVKVKRDYMTGWISVEVDEAMLVMGSGWPLSAAHRYYRAIRTAYSQRRVLEAIGGGDS